MQLHCLGTAGYHPSENRHTSCYMIPEVGLVLDAGSGFFRVAERVQTPTLDILLSHAHLDHVWGLTFLLDLLHQSAVKEVRVWGEREKLAAIRTHLTSRLIFPVDLPVQWCPIDEETKIAIAGGTVTWRSQQHPGGSIAFRVDWPMHAEQAGDAKPPTVDKSLKGQSDGPNVSLVYATDTTGAKRPEILRWMSGADVLLHECNFSDEQEEWAEKTGHCWPQRIAEICQVARPGRLVLTHINPICELELPASDPRFSMPVEIARDHQVLDLE